MKTHHSMLLCVALAVTSVTLAGCGGSREAGLAVSGNVTFQGSPLAQGNIAFIAEQEGRSASATISDGTYQIPADLGPTPGEYCVEITSLKGTGKMIEDPDLYGQKVEETRQIIPARYNDKSELKETVAADGENHFEFELKSK